MVEESTDWPLATVPKSRLALRASESLRRIGHVTEAEKLKWLNWSGVPFSIVRSW
ncbi:MAG: hypothetical protein WDM96_12180 [Lacunisphaera sp.]